MAPSSKEAALSALREAEARFIANNPLSKAQHELALGSLPGGNTRTLLHTSPFPVSMERGQGAHVWDLDGHKSVASFFLSTSYSTPSPFSLLPSKTMGHPHLLYTLASLLPLCPPITSNMNTI